MGPLPGWEACTASAFQQHVREFVTASAKDMQLPTARAGAHSTHVNFGVTRPHGSAFQAGAGKNKSVFGLSVLGPHADLVHGSLRRAFSAYAHGVEAQLARRGMPPLGGLPALLERAHSASNLLGGVWPFQDLPVNGFEFFGLPTPKCADADSHPSAPHADVRDTPGLPVCAFYPFLRPEEVVSPFTLWLGSETVTTASQLDQWAERDKVLWRPDAPGAYILIFQPFDWHQGVKLRGGKRAFGMACMCNRQILGGPFPIIQNPWAEEWEALRREVRERARGRATGYDQTVRAAAVLWRQLRAEGRSELPAAVDAEWARKMLFPNL